MTTIEINGVRIANEESDGGLDSAEVLHSLISLVEACKPWGSSAWIAVSVTTVSAVRTELAGVAS